MNTVVAQVKKTNNYSLFKFNPLNRSIKKNKLKQLRTSIQRTAGNLQSILVDSKYYIIDGQHRFMVCKSLNLPIRYEIRENTYTAEDIIEINNNGSGWNHTDYADHHFKKGNENYGIFLKYRELYPELKEGVLCSILENKYSMNDTSSSNMKRNGFHTGSFVVLQENKAKLLLQKLKDISAFYKGWNRRAFVYAIIHLSNQPSFNWDKFISKMQIKHIGLFEYPRAEDFVKALTEIYNYRERSKIQFITL